MSATEYNPCPKCGMPLLPTQPNKCSECGWPAATEHGTGSGCDQHDVLARELPPTKDWIVPTPPASPAVTPSDTDRLTWLTQTKAYVAWSRDGETCHLVWPYNPHDEEDQCGLLQPECYTSPREAIDAAMRGNMPTVLALLRAAERQK